MKAELKCELISSVSQVRSNTKSVRIDFLHVCSHQFHFSIFSLYFFLKNILHVWNFFALDIYVGKSSRQTAQLSSITFIKHSRECSIIENANGNYHIIYLGLTYLLNIIAKFYLSLSSLNYKQWKKSKRDFTFIMQYFYYFSGEVSGNFPDTLHFISNQEDEYESEFAKRSLKNGVALW